MLAILVLTYLPMSFDIGLKSILYCTNRCEGYHFFIWMITQIYLNCVTRDFIFLLFSHMTINALFQTFVMQVISVLQRGLP